MLDAWKVIDASGWAPGPEETRGLRAKLWVVDGEGQFWLRKSPRDRSPNELAIECLALRLAKASGLDAAEAWPCEWRDPDHTGGSRGTLVRRFVSGAEELHSGDQLLRGADASYDPEHRPQHTLTRVRGALQRVESSPGALTLPFTRMLVFDALIGNGDRHQGNWSVIMAAGAARLAPMYDPAACLGAELDSQHPLVADPANAERLRRYMDRCPSGFGNGTRLISQQEVVAEAARWEEWPGAASVVRARFRRALEHVPAFLEQVPLDWYPEGHRRLAHRLLVERAERVSL